MRADVVGGFAAPGASGDLYYDDGRIDTMTTEEYRAWFFGEYLPAAREFEQEPDGIQREPDHVDQWIRDLYPNPARTGKDFNTEMTAGERAIFVSHFNAPDSALDESIRKRDRRWAETGARIFTTERA